MWRLSRRLLASIPAVPGRHSNSKSQISFSSWLPALRPAARQPPAEPGARPETIRLGEQQLVDPYSWLSDYQQAQGYIQQEQAYFQAAARQLAPLQRQLLAELRQHVRPYQQAGDPPEPDGPYLYSTRFTPEATQTVSRCVSHEQQQVVVSDALIQRDLLELQQSPAGLQLAGVERELTALKLSRDQQLLAYGLAGGALEQQCCIARDLRTGRVLPHLFVPSVTSFEWSADGCCLYYTTPDETGRPSQVYRRDVSSSAQQPAAAQDTLLFSDPDPKHFITLTRTKDWAYVLINSTSKLSSEVHLLDAQDPTAQPVCVLPRQPGLEYFVEHCAAGHLLILTNLAQQQQQGQQSHGTAGAADSPVQSAADYSLYTVPVGRGLQDWRLLLPEAPGTAITDMDVFDGVAALHTLHHSRPQLTLLHVGASQQGTLEVSSKQEVALPEWALWLRPGNNSDHHSRTFRLYASSPAHPEVPLEVDLTTGILHALTAQSHTDSSTAQQVAPCLRAPAQPALVQQQQPDQQPAQQPSAAPTLLQPPDSGLVSERLWAAAPDGTAVPLTLLQQQRSQGTGSLGPLLVEVYGAYGHVLESEFKPHRMTLLQRGWSVALAHVRGGGELSRRWHASGRQLLKHHSVSDLLACLQHLIALGVTRPGLIAGHAASAGALTLAAAINARPELFSAAVLEAPYLDLVAGTGAVGQHGQPLVGDHLLTEHETDEWGQPWSSSPAAAEAIVRLCPYTNLQPAGVRYPALMLTAGLQDSRVPWWMPVKFVAKLRSSVGSQVLLQFDEGGSHFSMGLSGGSLQDAALQQAFLCTHTPSCCDSL